jgi:hypothetical protein
VALMTTIKRERWVPIDGHPGYEISSRGRARSVDRTIETVRGPRHYPGKMLKATRLYPRKNAEPYLVLHLGRPREGSPRTWKLVHVLVATAFLGERPEGMEVCHFNGHHRDNRAENLRWDTHKNNAADMVRHGRAGRPKRSAAA